MFGREDKTERFFVSGAPGGDDVVAEGFRWLASYAAQQGHDGAALVLPGVKNAQYLERIIGARPAKRLAACWRDTCRPQVLSEQFFRGLVSTTSEVRRLRGRQVSTRSS